MGGGLAQMTSEGSPSPEMHSMVLGREGEWSQRIGWADWGQIRMGR